jgi:2-polyprenyl-3-methyl-5-hydroxy-6-metoxy-1,4-benzoquinol methylase
MTSPADYTETYDTYWANSDRVGESSADMEHTASLLINTCGLGKVLDIGSGEGALVSSLLRKGIDAFGIDVSDVVIDRARTRFGDRFVKGSVLDLPFKSGEFETIVSTDCMEHLAPEDVPQALSEMFRVSSKYVFLQLATTVDRDGHWHLTIERRDWWEQQCFEVGFRKHPAYYRLNAYEALNNDPWQIFILLEKIPHSALEKFPLPALEAESGLHMDMSRVTGERSDAHMIRYHWSSGYIRPNDRVLDAACGLGYGSRLVSHNTLACSVHGVDGSDWAIDYAKDNFASVDAKLSFSTGYLPECLVDLPEGSFDVILSFETLEHVDDPEKLIAQFHRLLTPGGRLIVSVPNDWSDETGEDPNPFHLQVYDWDRLTRELGARLLVEDRYVLNASQAKIIADPPYWVKKQREIRRINEGDEPGVSEWCLMTAMKTPIGTQIPYEERPFSNIVAAGHNAAQYSRFYDEPWLVHSMVNVSFRMRNVDILRDLCDAVISGSRFESNDYAAAICVRAYLNLDAKITYQELISHLSLITAWLELPKRDEMHLRWKVSLLFVQAKTLTALGLHHDAIDAYAKCTSYDVTEFGIHLATKVAESFYWAGRLSYSSDLPEQAKQFWLSGIEYGETLLATTTQGITIDPDFPNLYNTGDGIREYIVAWDYINRCANGIHLLRIGKVDATLLDGSFNSEYTTVTNDLMRERSVIQEQRMALDVLSVEIANDRQDLIKTRAALVERTADLVHTREVLVNRTHDLVETRAALVERTDELVRTRKALVRKKWFGRSEQPR